MDLAAAISEPTASPALILAAGLLLGALHGLEPGHSKTMMAAFIIAARGTVGQAILLGLSAAVSHSIVVWILALLALRYGEALISEEWAPAFSLASGVLVIGVAIWIALRTWHTRRATPRDRVSASDHAAETGEPGHHRHDHRHDHGHDDHAHAPADAHARAHAAAMENRFAGGRTTTWQTILFGLSGGLIPCAAAIPLLILCLHLGKFWLGVGLVAAFSAGLAATLVAAGIAAAVGARYVSRRRSHRLDGLFRRAPYLSAAIIALIGIGVLYSALATPHSHLG